MIYVGAVAQFERKIAAVWNLMGPWDRNMMMNSSGKGWTHHLFIKDRMISADGTEQGARFSAVQR